jgi:multidrug efflux system outer membrane protein
MHSDTKTDLKNQFLQPGSRAMGFFWALLTVLFWAGCAPVGPNYQKPRIETPDVWHEKIAHEMARKSGPALQTWWRVFDDAILNELIEEARKSNLDLKIAFSKIAASRARLGVASGRELPDANAVGFFSRFKHSDKGSAGAAGTAGRV